MSTVHLAGPVAYLSGSSSSVFFSKSNAAAGTYQSTTVRGTAAPVKALQSALEVAYWGEDNRFPQNIEQQMAWCGVGKAALDWKAKALWGSGIIPGKVTDYEDGGKTEIFQPLDRNKYKKIYNLVEARSFTGFGWNFYRTGAGMATAFRK